MKLNLSQNHTKTYTAICTIEKEEGFAFYGVEALIIGVAPIILKKQHIFFVWMLMSKIIIRQNKQENTCKGP